MARRHVVAVIGSGQASPEMVSCAEAVGAGLVGMGVRLITGGREGVMAAASRGARNAPGWRDGDILAVVPGYQHAEANPWADVVLPTGLGHARNAVVVAAGDVVVLIGGEAGSLSEVGLARKIGRPVVVVRGTGGLADRASLLLPHDPGIVVVSSAQAALEAVAALLAR